MIMGLKDLKFPLHSLEYIPLSISQYQLHNTALVFIIHRFGFVRHFWLLRPRLLLSRLLLRLPWLLLLDLLIRILWWPWMTIHWLWVMLLLRLLLMLRSSLEVLVGLLLLMGQLSQ